MMNKQSSPIHALDQSMLQQSASSNSLIIHKSNRKFLVFCAFLLTLLLGSSLQLASSYLPSYDRRAYQRAFIGRRFFIAGTLRQARAEDFVHEERHAGIDRSKEALYCDRSHYRTDVCVVRGDVRVLGGTAHGGSYQVLVSAEQGRERVEKVKPYTRKWETSVMKTIDEVMVIKKVLHNGSSSARKATSSRFDPQHAEQSLRAYGDHSTPITSFLHQNKEVAARFNRSAKLQRMRLAQISIKPRQKQRSSTHRHQKGLHKRPNDPSGNIQSLQRLLEERGSFAAQSSMQQKKAALAADAINGTALQPTEFAELERPADYNFPACDVQHEVPAILFSTGGYTGNVYHEFNDGLIPLFITAQQYRPPGQVVLILLEYHDWWMSKYAEVVAQISNYTVIDLARDKRVHCFPEVAVGLRIHDELAIHTENPDHASIEGFQSMLRAAYAPPAILRRKPAPRPSAKKRRKLVIISRSSPRALVNEKEVAALAEEIGFSVQVLTPTPSTRMAEIYNVLNRCDVVVGVHGAAMTHLLFMRPGATLIQVVPLGTDWAAMTYYGEPAQKLGLNYVAYKVRPRESSLWHKYARDDPVLVSPESVNQKGWWETKRIYLEAQDVTVSLPRMRVTLLSAYARAGLFL